MGWNTGMPASQLPEQITNIALRPWTLTAPLILLDTAHDGVFEQRLYDMLDAAGYEGLLLLDDIYLNAPQHPPYWHLSLRLA